MSDVIDHGNVHLLRGEPGRSVLATFDGERWERRYIADAALSDLAHVAAEAAGLVCVSPEKLRQLLRDMTTLHDWQTDQDIAGIVARLATGAGK